MTKAEKYHHGDLRNALIDEAMNMIAEKGVQAVTVREISKRLGVSHAAPYRHFADRTALLCAVAAEGFRRQAEALVSCVADDQTPREQMESLAMAYMDFAVSNPTYYRLMFANEDVAAAPTDELKEASRKSMDVVMRAYLKASNGAGMSPEEAQINFMILWTVVHGLTMLLIQGQMSRVNAELSLHDMLSERFVPSKAPRSDMVTEVIGAVINGFFRSDS
ncbi:MAG: TetR/AcrR family transcriptional regulator [Planctomycetota bacterium]